MQRPRRAAFTKAIARIGSDAEQTQLLTRKRTTNRLTSEPILLKRKKGTPNPKIDRTKRTKQATKSHDNESNVPLANGGENVVRPAPIKCRRVTVALDRLSTGTMNAMLGIDNGFVASSQPVRNNRAIFDDDDLVPASVNNDIEPQQPSGNDLMVPNINQVQPGKIQNRRNRVTFDVASDSSDNRDEPSTSNGNSNLHPMAASINQRRLSVNLKRLTKKDMDEMMQIDEEQENIQVAPNQSQAMRIETRRATVPHKLDRPASNVLTERVVDLREYQCVVQLDRLRLSNYAVLPPIQEDQNEVPVSSDADDSDGISIVSSTESSVISKQNATFRRYDADHEKNDVEIDSLIDRTSTSVISLRQMQKNACQLSDVMTTINAQPKSVAPTQEMVLTPAMLVAEAMNYNNARNGKMTSRAPTIADDQTTYLHRSSITSYSNTHLTPNFVMPYEQMQLSQTRSQISWNIARSVSGDSVAVTFSPSNYREYLCETNMSSAPQPKKFFLDSSNVSFGPFVEFNCTKFAVDCFDHNDNAIQMHFLTKFSRSHLCTLNADFKGEVYTTQITAQLLYKYSTLPRDQINVLKYDEKNRIEGVIVTAVEIPEFIGGAIFLFECEGAKTVVHVSDLRLPEELELNASLSNAKISEVRFDKKILSGLFYQFPPNVDRYIDLMHEIYTFMKDSQDNGLQSLIAIGTFEVGMEFLVHRLVGNFSCKIFMEKEKRQFLETMRPRHDPDSIIHKILKNLVDSPENALIHVLPVEYIAMNKLMKYIQAKNYHRVLGIRPRGCDTTLQTVVDGVNKIVDISNPLIGDLSEIQRFVLIHTQRDILIAPTDHNIDSSNRIVPF